MLYVWMSSLVSCVVSCRMYSVTSARIPLPQWDAVFVHRPLDFSLFCWKIVVFCHRSGNLLSAVLNLTWKHIFKCYSVIQYLFTCVYRLICGHMAWSAANGNRSLISIWPEHVLPELMPLMMYLYSNMPRHIKMF